MAWLNFWLAAALACLGVGLTLGYARKAGMLAHPGARDSHHSPIPTGGGLGMITALALFSWLPLAGPHLDSWWRALLVPAALLMCVLGWLDDRHPLSWKLRLSVQVAVSIGLLVLLPQLGSMEWSADGLQTHVLPGWLAWPILLLCLVGIMNVYNFMDGSNGMAGSQGLFAGLMLAWLGVQAGQAGFALAALLVAAACLGFLPWNLPRARIFMGDAGSIPLGLLLGALCLLAAGQGMLPLPAVLLVLGVFLVDAGLTLIRRLIRGERWYTAHRQHLYQKLIDQGWTHTQALLLYQGINCLLIAPAMVIMAHNQQLVWPLTGTLIALLVAAWTIASLKLGNDLEGQ